MIDPKTNIDAHALRELRWNLSRRDFIGRAVALLAVAIAPGCDAEPMPAAAMSAGQSSQQPPAQYGRPHGAARISVRETGAHGDGEHDDTAAFQRAIDALPPGGGAVEVPAGRYLIDAEVSVRPCSRMHLQLADDAVLVAKPNAEDRGAYVLYVFRVEDVEISGGRIIGERERHRGAEGEWGHGIQVRGASRVTVRDMHISDCWGDGICAGAARARKRHNQPKEFSQDLVIARVVSTGNRRQGLSIGGCRDVNVFDSEFSDTHGTAPQCGIDIEPDRPDGAHRVHIRNCLVRRNAAYGILAFKRTHDVTIEGCTIEDNRSCGVVTVGCIGGRILANTIRGNGSTGLFIKGGSTDIEVRQNIFRNNYTRQTPPPRAAFSMAGVARKTRRDILVSKAASDITIATNHYR